MTAIILIGYYFSIVTVNNLNFALDNSEPIINKYEIIELENGDDNENDSAKVIINGVEYDNNSHIVALPWPLNNDLTKY